MLGKLVNLRDERETEIRRFDGVRPRIADLSIERHVKKICERLARSWSMGEERFRHGDCHLVGRTMFRLSLNFLNAASMRRECWTSVSDEIYFEITGLSALKRSE